MNTGAQAAQPISLFYGAIASDTGGGQELATGFDYVITDIVITLPGGVEAVRVILADESDVPFFDCIVTAPGAGGAPFVFSGEMPIGPRTQLNYYVGAGGCTLHVGGYALTPPSTLHI